MTSGTYTPTITGVANVTATTAYVSIWMRIGNAVVVAGKVDVDPTLALIITQIGISLPVPSAFATAEQCAGSGGQLFGGATVQPLAVYADTANDRAQAEFIPQDANNRPCVFHFMYLVV